MSIMATEQPEPEEEPIGYDAMGAPVYQHQLDPDDEPLVSIQLSGKFENDYYTAWAKIGPDDKPLAVMTLHFNEDIVGVAVQALVQAFLANVDGIIEDLDSKRAAADGGAPE